MTYTVSVAPTLAAIRGRLPARCPDCNRRLADHLEYYDHDGGWTVRSFDKKQWLYLHCPRCNYDWAIWKLGYPREPHTAGANE